MSDYKIPLLSIVIPTKNRQFTCLYAIASALLINNDDFEVVVQDCSDTNILQQQIHEKFGMDPRIKYFYSDEKLSMTDNWNRAFSNTKGEYICAIGDDDAVLPAVFEIAKWAKQRNVNMVKHPQTYNCSWPGYFTENPNGILYYKKNLKVTGDYSMVQLDNEKLYEFCTLKNVRIYLSFPNIYHSLFSRNLMETIKKDTGVFLDSTALDAYMAVVLFKYLKEYAIVNYPFTLPGSAPNSNSHRFEAGKIALHFKEFSNLKFPDFLPQVYGLTKTVAESIYTACKNTHQEALLEKIDLPYMYASIYFESKGNFFIILKKLQQYKKSKMDYVYFFSHIINEYKKKTISVAKEKAKKTLQKIFPVYFAKLRAKYGGAESYQIDNTIEAVSIIRNQLKECKLLLN